MEPAQGNSEHVFHEKAMTSYQQEPNSLYSSALIPRQYFLTDSL
jgi:hypothetical protein